MDEEHDICKRMFANATVDLNTNLIINFNSILISFLICILRKCASTQSDQDSNKTKRTLRRLDEFEKSLPTLNELQQILITASPYENE